MTSSTSITQATLQAAREEALRAIAAATQRKNDHAATTTTARTRRDRTLVAASNSGGKQRPRDLQEATSLSATAVRNVLATTPTNDTPATTATLAELTDANEAYRTAATSSQAAFSDWLTLLIHEHNRQLLRPTEIYRAADISKQRFSILRRQREAAQRKREEELPAANQHLPPDQEQVAAAWDSLAAGAPAVADGLRRALHNRNNTPTSAAYGPTFTGDGNQ